MAITVLNSNPCETEEMATASLAGLIAGYERGGHSVAVREMRTEETPAGWIAFVSIEIDELEEEEEADKKTKDSEMKKAEEVIEEQNSLFYAMHHTGQSEAQRAFPEVEGGPDPVQLMDEREERRRELEELYKEEAPRDQDLIGIESSADELSQTFENDFQVAIEREPELDVSGVIYVPEDIFSEEELARRRRTEELTPEPQE